MKELYVKQENYEYKKECVHKTVSPKSEDTVKLQCVYTNLCQKFNYKICFTMSMEFARGKESTMLVCIRIWFQKIYVLSKFENFRHQLNRNKIAK